MTADPDRFLRITRRFDAAPERVFDAWLNPKTVRKWLFTSPADEMYTAELDARVGGKWTVTARRGGILTLTQAGIDIADELRQLPPGVEGGTEKGWNDMFDALARALD